MRCGGSVFLQDGNLFRPSQFHKNYYGENLELRKITELTPNSYCEQPIKMMLNRENEWSKFGGHHLNILEYKGETIIAMDGKIKDSKLNNRTRLFFQLWGRETKRVHK